MVLSISLGVPQEGVGPPTHLFRGDEIKLGFILGPSSFHARVEEVKSVNAAW